MYHINSDIKSSLESKNRTLYKPSFKGSWEEHSKKTDLFERLAADVYTKTSDASNSSFGIKNKKPEIKWQRIKEHFKDALFTRQTEIKDHFGNSYLVKVGNKKGVTYTAIYGKNPNGTLENLVKDNDGYLYSSKNPTIGERLINQSVKNHTLNDVDLFISDLHIGKKNILDEFTHDNTFAKFLEQQSNNHKTDSVNLVLLGDIIDLWQLSPDNEYYAKKASDIELEFPIKNQKQVSFAINRINNEITTVFKKHPKIAESIQKFLSEGQGDRKITYVIGNHDHAMVHPEIQEHTKRVILGNNYEKLKNKIVFDVNYDNPKLKVYAEHGNQYDNDSFYSNFKNFGEESTGYYFVRLFWNRAKHACPELTEDINIKEISKKIFNSGNIKALPKLVKYFYQYLRDDRIPLNKKVHVLDHIIRNRHKEPVPLEPSLLNDILVNPILGLKRDKYIDSARKMFYSPGYPNLRTGNLDKNKYNTVILGHSHNLKDLEISRGIKYYNSGTWKKTDTEKVFPKYPYIEIIKNENDAITSKSKNHIE